MLATLSTSEVQDYCSGLRIQWKFIVERAPWWGGWWERVIRTTKDVLKRALGRSSLTFEALQTLLCEVEAAVNSRPLTTLGSDPSERQPLCPSYFLIGRRLTAIPHQLGEFNQLSTESSLQKQAKLRQTILGHFWRRWKHEYLLQLRSAHESFRLRPQQSRLATS